MTELYKSFDVWKRKSPRSLVRYRCFEDVASSRFCIQSADLYSPPFDFKDTDRSDKQFLELLLEESPFVRSQWFDSVEAAIHSHDEDFS